MTESNSTAPTPKGKPSQTKHRKRKAGKRHPGEPAKPYKGFPLFTVSSGNGNGRWAKKVRGKLHYFGSWDDPEAALQRWNDQKDDLLAGRIPRTRASNDEPTLRDLCNRFMTTKTNYLDPVACRGILQRADKKKGKELAADLREVLEKRAGAKDNAGGLSIHSWTDYGRVCKCLIETFGKDRLLTDLLPEDFERLRANWAEKWGPVRLGNNINLVHIVFRYGFKNGMLAREMQFGEGFNRPSKKTLRLTRAEKGLQMFEAVELRRIIEAATQPMKAMILLAINCGLGNNDVAMLTMTGLDLKAAWLTYARPKTGIMRRCPLWPETIKALKEWLAHRPEPSSREHAELVFVTAKGGSWAKETSDNPVSKETRKLLDRLRIISDGLGHLKS